MKARTWIVCALVVYVCLALVMLTLPVSYAGVVASITDWLREDLGVAGVRRGAVEFVSNIVLFIPLGLLLALALRGPVRAFLILVALSVVVETLQALIPGRFPSVRDILANSVGAGLGVCAAAAIMAVRRRARRRATTRAR